MQTNPKTLGVAVYCPVDLDDETGPFLHSRSMEQGYYCRPLADYPTELEVRPLYPLITDGLRCLTWCVLLRSLQLHLRPTAFDGRGGDPGGELLAELQTAPAAERAMKRRDMMLR